MDRIFADAKDKNVVGSKIYTKSGSTFGYSDSDCTKKIEADELTDMFIKGAFIIVSGSLYKPVSCVEASGIVTLTYVTTDTTTATTAKLATVKSGTNE